MKKRIYLACAVVALLFVVGWTQQPKQAWEYKIEYNISEKKLNQLADQGWELVAASPEASTSNLTGFYFKRPKQ